MNRRSNKNPGGKLKTYLVIAEVTISMHTKVEAESLEAAKAAALDHPLQGLCHQCSSGSPEVEWVTSGEFDGEPTIVEVEPAS